jgi:hypothetical protein
VANAHYSGMAKFKKGFLKANRTYHSPDDPLPVSQGTLTHWRDTFKAFKSKGLKVPMYWGHQDRVELSTPKRRLPNECVGHLDDLQLSSDGKSLEITVDVPRKEDADKVRHNLAELSPVVFRRWKDGDGKVYENCITGVDLVQHPVDHRQTDFTEVLSCSIRMGLDMGKPIVYRLADDDEPPSDEAPPEESSDDEEIPDEPVGDDGSRLKKVTESLARMNVVLSDDTNEENFLEHLENALLTVEAMANGSEMTSDEGLEQANPEQFASFSLQSSREKKYLDKQHRSLIATRLTSVLHQGQCTPAEYKVREPQLKSIRLSLDDEGDSVPSPLETWVASREAVPRGTFWDPDKRTRMSALDLAPQPKGLSEGMPVTDEDSDAVVNSIFKRR